MFPTADDYERIYASLRLVRRVEEEIARVYPTDKVKSPVHLSIGQESVAVGVIDALRSDDIVGSSYRSHAAYIARGGDLGGMIAELFGKVTGVARGKGGSMHLISPEHHVLGSSAVVGTHIPVAAGHALALRREGGNRIVAVFFGDGATEEGCFYETLNFAALHRLPMLFVCENNGYAIHTPLQKRWATNRLCERVRTYGMPAEQMADADVFRLRQTSAAAVEKIRAGGGPAFIECPTYRWLEHVGPNEDYQAGYRSRSELVPWLENDEIEKAAKFVPAGRRTQIDAEIEQRIAESFRFAEDSPPPPLDELAQHVYA